MKKILVCVVECEKKVLILKRQENTKFDPGLWEFVSGFPRDDNKALEDQATSQVCYETTLSPTLLKKGDSFIVKDKYGSWQITPFLFTSETKDVVLTQQHSTYEWINPKEIRQLERVRELEKNFDVLGVKY